MQHTDFFDATMRYAHQHSSPLSPILKELERETHLHTLSPQMIAGEFQGQLLRMLSLMLRPRRVLEVGTFTGYSTLCLAEGLSNDGKLHTIEINDELAWIAEKFFHKAGLAEKITLHIGDAAAVLPQLDEQFDLVYLDAGKLNYSEHLTLALPKTRTGGWLIADNVLWDGKVVRNERDATSRTLSHFNRAVHENPCLENLLLPVCDGLLLMRKIADAP